MFFPMKHTLILCVMLISVEGEVASALQWRVQSGPHWDKIGVERNAAAGGDVKVKGLIFGSAEIDTELFESLRLLGTVLPGGEGEQTDFVSELQVAYSLGRVNIAGLGWIGWERGEWSRRYTGLVQVPF